MIGQRFDQYRIIERVGDGGMGTVYRAVDETLGREVAVKLLRPELANRADVVERFHMEAITLGKLNHSNIATLYGLSRRGQDCFMVMEYVRGETLEQVLRRTGRLPWDVAVRIGRQVLAALAYAHGLQVVHRDIKPSNLMLDSEGRIKVMDFGLARVLGSDRSTRVGHIVGTLEYMAPEQIRGHEVDGRTDLYALAVVLYELLAGSIPFKATSDYALMTAHLEETVAPLRQSLPEIPEWLDRAISVGLAKQPEARHATAHTFRAALAAGSPGSDLSHSVSVSNIARITVDDPTDPVPVGFADAVARIARTTPPPTRLAGTPPASGPDVRATRLAGAPQQVAVEGVETSAPTDRRVVVALGAIGLVIVAIGLSVFLRPSTAQPAATAVVAAASAPSAPKPTPTPPASAPAPARLAPPEAPVPREMPPVTPPAPTPLPPPPSVADGGTEAPRPPVSAVEPPRPAVPEHADLSGVARSSTTLPPRTFDKVNVITWDEDEPEEKAIRLTLQADRLVLRDAQSNRVVRSVPYSDIASVVYSSKDPKLESGVGPSIGKVLKAPVSLFRRGQRHWLTVNTDGEPLFIRLDKQRVDEVLPALEQHTGVAIARGGR